jgi:histidinol-phosphate aminotransferase
VSAPSPRPGILDISPYVPGKSTVAGAAEIIKLSSNEGALGPSPRAIDAYVAAASALHRYPDGGSTELREAIGARYGLDPARIVCGAGSDELLYLLGRGYAGPGDEILTHAHAFVMYRLIALGIGATIVEAEEVSLTADVDNILAAVSDRTRVVYVANPNNPTGSYISADELARLRAGLSDDVLLVIDSAYAEYVLRNDYDAGVALVDAGDNTVMTRTFSKAYALGGVRLGWCYCPGPIADVLNRIRAPFNVATPAQAAGIAAIEDTAFMAVSRDHNAAWLPWLSDRIGAAGLTVYPSVANFVLVRFPQDADRNAAAALAFMGRRGIIPRETDANGLAGCLRITIGRETEMRAVADALDAFMA